MLRKYDIRIRILSQQICHIQFHLNWKNKEIPSTYEMNLFGRNPQPPTYEVHLVILRGEDFDSLCALDLEMETEFKGFY